jgi:hypothetical protein
VAHQLKSFRDLYFDPVRRGTALLILGVGGTVAVSIWPPPNHRLAYPIIVFLLSLLVFDNGISQKTLKTSMLDHMRTWERKFHQKLDEELGAEAQGHALAHWLNDAEEFKKRAMTEIKNSHSHIYTVLSESSAEYLMTNFDQFSKVISQRLEEEHSLHFTVLYGVNLSAPTKTTMEFLQAVRPWEERFVKHERRYKLYVCNGEAQLEFSVYDNRCAAIFPSATRSMTLFFDSPPVSRALGRYFIDTLTHRGRKLYSVDEAIDVCSDLAKRLSSPGESVA